MAAPSAREMVDVENIIKPAKSPNCFLGEVTRPSESRLSETRAKSLFAIFSMQIYYMKNRNALSHVVPIYSKMKVTNKYKV